MAITLFSRPSFLPPGGHEWGVQLKALGIPRETFPALLVLLTKKWRHGRASERQVQNPGPGALSCRLSFNKYIGLAKKSV